MCRHNPLAAKKTTINKMFTTMETNLALFLLLHNHILNGDDESSDDDDDNNNNVMSNTNDESFEQDNDDDDDDELFELFFLIQATLMPQNQQYTHSRNRKAFHNSLSTVEKQLRDRRIPRISLHDPSASAWRQLYLSRNDQALVTLTGFDHRTFAWLLRIFEPVYNNYSPGDNDENGYIVPIRHPNNGRPRLLTAADCLGLNLAWTRLRGSLASLQMLFGTTGSRTSKWLRFGRRILVMILHNHVDAAVKLPNAARFRQYKNAIQARHPGLHDVWCTMDGLKITLQQSGDSEIQNMFYNGWTHDHYVSSVLVFCPDGTIPIAAINYPGCFHDSQIAEWGKIYKKLETIYNENGGKCVVDSAFAQSRFNFLIKSSQTDPIDIPQALLNREATSLRQSAEWGMRALQSSFPRLKDRLIYEETGERKIILKMLVLLFNVRSRRVGINQILNTYMPALERNANEEFIQGMVREN